MLGYGSRGHLELLEQVFTYGGSKMIGSCNCGAVQFHVAKSVSNVFICHCSICRKSTGGNGIAYVLVPKGGFRWESGVERISHWKKPEAEWETWFCSVCGSRLPGPNDASRMFIPASLFSDPSVSLKVAHHIWVGSKAEWDEIGDDGVQHPEGMDFGQAIIRPD